MEHTFLGALRRGAARVIGSRFAKPIARAGLATAGLAVLAFVGRTAIAGAGAFPAAPVASASTTTSAEPPHDAPAPTATASGPTAPPPPTPAARASAEDPVVLNAAAETDLRRLPGIGARRAEAILMLRTRLGRFRAVEDLLKVKGIGRASLKRLRPLVRLDLPAIDAGPPRPTTSSPP